MLALEASRPAAVLSLPANLFSSAGKLSVEITTLAEDRATVVADERLPEGSFAFLVRNRVKVPAMIAWRQGRRIGLSFEQPFAGDRREEAFRGGDRVRRDA